MNLSLILALLGGLALSIPVMMARGYTFQQALIFSALSALIIGGCYYTARTLGSKK